MPDYLVDKQHDLIQYEGRTFRIPNSLKIRTDIAREQEVMALRRGITADEGLELFPNGEFACRECSFNGMMSDTLQRMKSDVVERGYASDRMEQSCVYDQSEGDFVWLSFYKGDDVAFAAKKDPCVADSGLVKAVAKLDRLAEFEVDTPDQDLTVFPTDRELTPEVVETAVQLYEALAIPRKSRLRSLKFW